MEISFTSCQIIEKGNMQSPSMINGAFVSASRMHMMLNCVITIDERVTIMAIEDTGNVKRKPAHPGEMLREDFLPDYGLTVTGLAVKKEVSRIRLLHSA